MFERYNEPARRSLFFARYEASMLGSPVIGTEHLLLGVLKEREPLITQLLGTANVTADALRQMIYARVGASAAPLDISVEIPFSRDAKDVLQYAAQEADRLLHGHIGPNTCCSACCARAGARMGRLARERAEPDVGPRSAGHSRQRELSPPARDRRNARRDAPGSAEGARDGPRPVYLMTALDGSSPGRRPRPTILAGGFASFRTVGFGTI